MIWVGLRQVVAVVLMSLAGLEQPQNVSAADAPRYEVEVKLKVDTKNQALSATSLRMVEQRVRATARLGSGGVVILMLPDADDPTAQRLVVRGTTVPRLVERLVGTSGMVGWARVLDASETAAIEAARAKGGRAKTKKTKYEETHGFPVPQWGASEPAFVRLEAGSDERAIHAAAIGRDDGDKDAGEVLWVSLETPGPDHRALLVAGMVVTADDVGGRPHIALPLPSSPEEQAALLGLIRHAPQMLPHPVLVLDTQIRPMPGEGAPTITQKIDAAKSASLDKLESAMKDPSPLVRRRVVLAAATKGAKARRLLERALTDPDPMVAAPALSALVAQRARPSLEELARLAASPAYDLARPALLALMGAGDAGEAMAIRAMKRERLLEAALPEIRAAKFRELAPVVERLALKGREPAVRVEAAATYAALAGSKARAVLEKLARDSDPEVRQEAARLLAKR